LMQKGKDVGTPRAQLIIRFCILFGICFACGCESKKKDRPEVYPVRGSLFIAGKPAVDARVMLFATANGLLPNVYCPHGIVAADSTFHLTTFMTNDGAPAGDYAVTVVWPGPRVKGQAEDEEGPDRLQGRYADFRRPPATVHITPDTRVLDPIRLK